MVRSVESGDVDRFSRVCQLWVNLSQRQISSSNFLRRDEMIAQCQHHRRCYLHYNSTHPPTCSPLLFSFFLYYTFEKINDGIREFSIGNFNVRSPSTEEIRKEGGMESNDNGFFSALDPWMDTAFIPFLVPLLFRTAYAGTKYHDSSRINYLTISQSLSVPYANLTHAMRNKRKKAVLSTYCLIVWGFQ